MNTRKTLLTALFSALIIVGAYIKFPLPPVPVTLQTLFVLLAGFLLGSSSGTAAVAIYIILGAAGLPVFTSGGGLGALFGPTGGFIFGLVPAAAICGIAKKHDDRIWPAVVLAVTASLVIYAVGVPYLKFSTGMTWGKAVMAGMTPFLIGDAIKAAAAIVLFRLFSKKVDALVQTN